MSGRPFDSFGRVLEFWFHWCCDQATVGWFFVIIRQVQPHYEKNITQIGKMSYSNTQPASSYGIPNALVFSDKGTQNVVGTRVRKEAKLMDPILPVGVDRAGWADRLSNIQETLPGGGTQPPASPSTLGIQTLSTMGISSSVQQLLQSVGGGLESNKMLEMMVTLLILLTLLEQQRTGGNGSNALSKLSGLSSGSQSMSFSATTISTQTTSISFTQLQASQSCGRDVGTAQPPQFDATA